MKTHRLRAPSTDGALLADPPLSEAASHLARNIDRLAGWDHDFQGRSAGQLRDLVRRQVVEKSRAYMGRFGLDVPDSTDPISPLVVTGHQPELFHPGVWVKNFAVAAIARTVGGAGLNLIVDNDIPKSSMLRVPYLEGGALRVRPIDYDDWAGEVPFEDLRVRDEGQFASFGDRARRALEGLVPDPLIDDFWPRAVAHRGLTDRIGLRFAAARREVEASWGAHNLEVPLGAVCETEGFLWFASHILAHLPRFQEVHNDALSRYRAVYGIRSRHHPVPALGRQGDWREAPFWVWRESVPRRRPLMIRQLSRSMEIRIGGEDDPLMEIPLAPAREACCAVDCLMGLPALGVRLRPRALTTTMFARLMLGDLFLHGIGGAKYDELGDEVVRGFFRVEPPGFLTLSMTSWLGLGLDPASPERLGAVDRLLRDLAFNPDRHLGGDLSPDVRGWVEAKRSAIAGPVETRGQRLARFAAIRRSNEALQPLIRDSLEALVAERTRLRHGLRRNAFARNREYSLVLHSRRRLHDAMAPVAVVVAGP